MPPSMFGVQSTVDTTVESGSSSSLRRRVHDPAMIALMNEPVDARRCCGSRSALRPTSASTYANLNTAWPSSEQRRSCQRPLVDRRVAQDVLVAAVGNGDAPTIFQAQRTAPARPRRPHLSSTQVPRSFQSRILEPISTPTTSTCAPVRRRPGDRRSPARRRTRADGLGSNAGHPRAQFACRCSPSTETQRWSSWRRRRSMSAAARLPRQAHCAPRPAPIRRRAGLRPQCRCAMPVRECGSTPRWSPSRSASAIGRGRARQIAPGARDGGYDGRVAGRSCPSSDSAACEAFADALGDLLQYACSRLGRRRRSALANRRVGAAVALNDDTLRPTSLAPCSAANRSGA